jgi:SAM-dependent methyltransferase
MQRYLALHSKRSPAYAVHRIAAGRIRHYGERYLRGRLLDIGCGKKAKQWLVGDLVDEYVGLDHVEGLHGLQSVDLQGTAYEIPTADATFDSILCTAVLEHLEEPLKALVEARRVLKAGGYGVYTIPLFWHLHEEPRDFFRYTKHGLRHLCKSAGLEVVHEEALSGFWVTWGAELGYYAQRFVGRGRTPLVQALVTLCNIAAPRLDAGSLRDERFTWMYLVVVRRPVESSATVPRS